jgi:hypothetical protein
MSVYRLKSHDDGSGPISTALLLKASTAVRNSPIEKMSTAVIAAGTTHREEEKNLIVATFVLYSVTAQFLVVVWLLV